MLAKNKFDQKKLFWALETGNAKVVAQAIRENAMDPRGDFAELRLLNAANKGHTELANLLLDEGVRVDPKNKYGWTPLAFAAQRADAALARLLIARGADLNAKSDHGWTPLMLAASTGSLELVKLLLESGADPGIENSKNSKAFDLTDDKRIKHLILKYPEKFYEDQDKAARQLGELKRKDGVSQIIESLESDIRKQVEE
ncbi:MAG: ankyrin repeat domain-containing protein [Candidatus Micrarchaeota archaeon]|nr:ankyrin repeat domain-containing protein [Candidatus Micrarchaeota archaeon]